MTDETAPPDPGQPPILIPTSPPERQAAGRGAPTRWTITVLLASVAGTVLFVAGFLAAGASTQQTGCSAPAPAFAALCEAYDALKQQYVDTLDDTQLAEGAIRGLFEYGVKDPFSGYMSPDDYQSALGSLAGKFTGIGAEMAVKNVVDPGKLDECTKLSEACVLVVVAPLADSPAEKAGLRAGDVISAVDGKSVIGTTLQEQIGKVRGEAGTVVTLTVVRGGGTFDLTITRAEIVQHEVTTRMLDGRIGYIALHAFSPASSDQFHAGLKKLLDDGATSIIFDLRDDPGGYIDAANRIASEFIGSGLIFSQESSGGEVKRWEAASGGLATDPSLRLLVLVNKGSASASEIVAAALKESGRATIIGQDTYGKNTVQVWTELQNKGGVRITISRWFTPDHHTVAPDGLQPDIRVEVPDGTPPERDLILERAVSELGSAAAIEILAFAA